MIPPGSHLGRLRHSITTEKVEELSQIVLPFSLKRARPTLRWRKLEAEGRLTKSWLRISKSFFGLIRSVARLLLALSGREQRRSSSVIWLDKHCARYGSRGPRLNASRRRLRFLSPIEVLFRVLGNPSNCLYRRRDSSLHTGCRDPFRSVTKSHTPPISAVRAHEHPRTNLQGFPLDT